MKLQPKRDTFPPVRGDLRRLKRLARRQRIAWIRSESPEAPQHIEHLGRVIREMSSHQKLYASIRPGYGITRKHKARRNLTHRPTRI